MSREELRADLLDDHGYCVNCGEDAEDCECGFEEFIDATVVAGWRKLSLDDATVERAACRIFADSGTGKADEWVYMPPEDERRIYFMNIARRALAAAVEAGQ